MNVQADGTCQGHGPRAVPGSQRRRVRDAGLNLLRASPCRVPMRCEPGTARGPVPWGALTPGRQCANAPCASFIRGVQLTVRWHFATLPPPCTTTKRFKAVEIKKAIITAAGKTQRTLPLQTLVDRDGVTKTALRILIEEILRGRHRGNLRGRLPGRSGRLRRGRRRAGRPAPVRRAERGPAATATPSLARVSLPAASRSCCWWAIISTSAAAASAPRSNWSRSPGRRIAPCPRCRRRTRASCLTTGRLAGAWSPGAKGLYEISEVLEKPTPTEAEQRLIVPGLRAGHYLCFFGMHVLTPAVMEMLAEEVARAGERRRASDHRAGQARQARALPGLRAGRRTATTSASSTACSPPNWPWRWTGRTGTRC